MIGGLLIYSVMVWRLLDLTVSEQLFLTDQGDTRSVRITEIPAYRGMIKDRRGEPLAISTPVYAVWINPVVWQEQQPDISALIELLQLSEQVIGQSRRTSQTFMYLKRGIDPDLAEAVEALHIPGVYLQREFKRFYPQGETTAHILGLTDIDDRGIAGIELAYNDWLQGEPGKQQVRKNCLSQVVQILDVIQPPRSGHDVMLTIDSRIQHVANQSLKKAMAIYQLKSGSIVVLDAKHGEILAMVNQPSFNPNQRIHEAAERRNRAVTDMFEPGSVMKPFGVALALDLGLYTTDTVIDTAPGYWVLNNHTIRDVRNFGALAVTDILVRSSNIGIAKIVLSLPSDKYLHWLEQLGLNRRTTSDFPGEAAGLLDTQRNWCDHSLATLAFGYSMAITPLQLAQAYSIFTGDGTLKPVSLLRTNPRLATQSILSSSVSKTMLQLLEAAVAQPRATGRRARVVGYRVAGKTGTARIAGQQGYDRTRHISSFVGIAPVSDPQVIIAVVLNEPQSGPYYGGAIAAPIFADVFAEIAPILGIRPDDGTSPYKPARSV